MTDLLHEHLQSHYQTVCAMPGNGPEAGVDRRHTSHFARQTSIRPVQIAHFTSHTCVLLKVKLVKGLKEPKQRTSLNGLRGSARVCLYVCMCVKDSHLNAMEDA